MSGLVAFRRKLTSSDQCFRNAGSPVTAETFRARSVSMIRGRQHQASWWTGVLAEEVDHLWDDEELAGRIFGGSR